jgi:S-methylmethionine-dependent homocysteine/selenocysteine methylase
MTGDGAGAAGLAARLAEGAPLVLDGAVGTELERRGVPCDLPLWSSHALLAAPALLYEIHGAYVAAGADVLTANTFRTQRRVLERAGVGEPAAVLCARAVAIARDAARAGAGGRDVFVVGSAPPLEDCYRPDLVPDDDVLAREHGEHAEALAAAGVDAVLVETMNCAREALAGTRAARAAGLAAWVSFVCWDGDRLLSGEPLARALDAVAHCEPAAWLVNCLPPSNVDACLAVLRRTGRPFGVYANLGAPLASGAFERSESCGPQDFAAHALRWRDAGARILGGCCGTTPAHIAALARALRNGPATRAT